MTQEEEQDYQRKMRKRINDEIKRQQLEQQKKEIMRQFLDSEAYERLMNIRTTNYELYDQVVNLIVSLVQQKRLSGKMTNEQLRSVLERITTRHEPTIDFKHK